MAAADAKSYIFPPSHIVTNLHPFAGARQPQACALGHFLGWDQSMQLRRQGKFAFGYGAELMVAKRP